ncbi:speckle targeted PIP5K1A-regulated poly(A) polymerase-like isoform X2 [Corticium candelabrum]|nr:speckle targeted PIP5K1A-regulated poly(A) polymerase-like isoform X2 [Corticium candelabrum]
MFALVEFRSAETALAVLQHTEPIIVNGARLLVKPRTVKEVHVASQLVPGSAQQVSSNKRVKVEKRMAACQFDVDAYNDVLEEMSSAQSIDQQAIVLVSGTRLTPEEVEKRYHVCSSLQSLLRSDFPNCILLPYGSSVSGLALQQADLDICLLTDVLPVDLTAAYSEGVDANARKEEKKCEFVAGDASDVLQTVARCLRRAVTHCERVRVITGTKCPIVQFRSVDLAISCDLSLGNRLALQNTQLLLAYINSNPSILPFIFSLRCWAMAKQLVSSHHPNMLCNYAFTLMAIHYLIQDKICPCLSELPCDEIEINGWDCKFSVSLIREEKLSIEKLLKGFFAYFVSRFDYKGYACCVHTSAVVDKHSVCADDLQLCVQDPFERSHILSQHVTRQSLDRFVAECEAALCVLTDYCKPVCDAGKGNEGKWGLTFLLQRWNHRTHLVSLSSKSVFNLLKNVEADKSHVAEIISELTAVSHLHGLLFAIGIMLSVDLTACVGPIGGELVLCDSQMLKELIRNQEAQERKIINKKRVCLALDCLMNERRWMKRRQQRRLLERGEDHSGIDDHVQSPLLKMRVYVSEYRPSDDLSAYDVHFEPTYLIHVEDFSTFFAFFKKTLLSLARLEQTENDEDG